MDSNKQIKIFRSENYNYDFNLKNGFFMRWGKTIKEDPELAPAPEILDIEVSTICNGLGTPCSWCYKSNTSVGKNMSFENFKIIFDKLPSNLTQIAFGIGDIDANPDLFKMFEYSRKNNVIPNVTINGARLTDEIVDKLVSLCGAVSVSHYDNETCYNAIKRLTDKGLKQVNIHQLLSQETYDKCFDVMKDSISDSRLEKLNAVVFLTLKPKGKRNKLTPLRSTEKYNKLIDFAFENKAAIGFDSCGAPMFIEAVKHRKNFKLLEALAEPCESTLFSIYIDVNGKMYPCSFLEDVSEPVDVLNCEDFIKDVWNNPLVEQFRKKLLATCDKNNCRKCPQFNIYE